MRLHIKAQTQASCTTTYLFYVRLSKNSFFRTPAQLFCAKADAKVQQIKQTAKLFETFFYKI